MAKPIKINIQNNLNSEKRDLNIYHHAQKGTHFISHGSSVTIPIHSEQKKDYIYISIVVGPGNLEKPNIVDLPAWLNYEFLSEGKFAAIHSNGRILLKIPAGLPEWKLKLTRPVSYDKQSEDHVTISDHLDE